MTSTKKIIEEIRRLSARERRIVIKHLEQLKSKPGAGTARRSGMRRTRGSRPYAALVELAGTAHGNFDDVSTEKYRHLAEVYGDPHEDE